MLNITQYSNKTEIIKIRLKAVDEKAMAMYDSGEYTLQEIELFMKSSIIRTLIDLASPSFQVREALTVPIFQEYSEMMQEAIKDIEGIIEDCKMMEMSLQNLSDKNTLLKKVMWNRISEVKKNIVTLSSDLNITGVHGNQWVFSESFASNEHVDSSDASIDIFSGVLTLKEIKNEKAKGMSLKIHEESDGFPGNMHEAVQSKGEIIFKGETDVHADLNEIVDEKEDTWFEYEVFKISPYFLEKSGMDGFQYQEGLSWTTEQNEMFLGLTITLDQETLGNKLVLKPSLVNSFGTRPSTIKSIKVFSEDRKNVSIIASQERLGEDKIFLFDEQPIKTIQIEILSEDAYATQAGHYFFGSQKEGEIVRTSGKNISIEPLGIKYSTKEKKFLPLSSHDEEGKKIIIDKNRIKEEFFGLHLREENCLKEILQADRFVIGLKEIALYKNEYALSSSYVSKNITMDQKISSVSLESDDYVPRSFGVPDNFLKYYISFDDGKEWLPIFPKHRSHNGPYIYGVNSLRTDHEKRDMKMLYKLEDVFNVKVKIEVSRPVSEKGKTPIVRYYKLKIQTGDEIID